MAGHVELGHQAEDPPAYFGNDFNVLLNCSAHSSNALGSDGCGIAAPSNTADPLSIWWQQDTPQTDLETAQFAEHQPSLQPEQVTNSGSTARLVPERPSCQQAAFHLNHNVKTPGLLAEQARRVPPMAATGTTRVAGQVPAATGFHDAFIPVMTNHPFSAQEGQSAPPSPRAVQSAHLAAQLAVETAQMAINTAVLLQQRLCCTPPAPCAGGNNFIDEAVAVTNKRCAFQLQEHQQTYAASSMQCRPRRNSCIAAFGNRGSPPPFQPEQLTSRFNSLGVLTRVPNRRSSYSVTSMFEQKQFAQQVQHAQAAAVLSGTEQLRRSSAGSLPANQPDPWAILSSQQHLPLQQLPAQQLRQPLIYKRCRPRRSSYSISLHPTPEQQQQQQQQWSMGHPRRNSWSAYTGAPAPHQLETYITCAASNALPAVRRPSLAVPCSTPLPRPGVWPGAMHASSSNSSSMTASAANQADAAAAVGTQWVLPWADGRQMLELLPEEVAETPSAGLEAAMAAAATAAATATPTIGLHGTAYPAGPGHDGVYGSALHAMGSMGPDQFMQMQDLPADRPADDPFMPDSQQHLQQLGSLHEKGLASILAANLHPGDYLGQQQQQQHANSGGLSALHEHQEQQLWCTNFWEQQQHPQIHPTADDFIRLTGYTDNMWSAGQLPGVPDSTYSSRRSSFSTQLHLQQAGLTTQQQQQQQGFLGHQPAGSVAQQQQQQEEASRCWRSSDSGGPLASSSSSSLPQLTVRTTPRRKSSSSSTCDYTSKPAPPAAAAAAVAGIGLDSGANALRIIQQELQHLQQLQCQLAAAAAAAAGTPVAEACATALHMHEGAMQQAVATKAALGAALGVPPGACSNGSKTIGGAVVQRQQPCQAGMTQPCDSAQFGIWGDSPGTLDSQACYCTVGSTV